MGLKSSLVGITLAKEWAFRLRKIMGCVLLGWFGFRQIFGYARS